MEIHKFPSAIVLYVLIFALVYYFNSSQFSGIESFSDAVLYSLANTCIMNYSEVKPLTNVAKLISSLQCLLTFTSLFSVSALENKSFIRFILINIGILAGAISAGTYYTTKSLSLDELSSIQTLYDTIRTHCLVDLNPQPKAKIVSIVHIIIVMFIVFKFNNGIFQRISDPVFGPNLLKIK